MYSLGTMTLSDLFRLKRAIELEVARRGHSRTAGSLTGEVMERVVADAYSGTLAPIGTKSIDAISGDGRRIQVKARSLPKGDLRHWALADFDFDAVVLVALDRETAVIDWARELTSTEAKTLARPHAKDGWRIRMLPARTAGRDVTSQLQMSLASLR